jgi:hypothetical protein
MDVAMPLSYAGCASATLQGTSALSLNTRVVGNISAINLNPIVIASLFIMRESRSRSLH